MEYDSGEINHVSLLASAGGVEVYLSMPSLQLEPAYMGLYRFVYDKVGSGMGGGDGKSLLLQQKCTYVTVTNFSGKKRK